MARDWHDDRIEELEAQARAQRTTIEEQRRVAEGLQQTIAKLNTRGCELAAQLARYSGNSSPPSTDPPGATPTARLEAYGRRPE